MVKIKVLELFAGYGGSSFALKKAGVDFEVVGFSEIDKYAVQCYKQNHQGKDLGDITKIDETKLQDFDLLTGGFPCQSFSNAGKGLGELDTRGTLFNDIIRIAEVKQPKYMLLENVKGLTSKRHKETFDKILNELKRIGYVVWWNILNSKDFGIPQNRERVWIVCMRKDLFDFEKNFFTFPQKEELKIFLKDILEDNPNNKYNLTDKNKAHYNRDFGSKGKILNGQETSPTLTTAMGSGGGNVPAVDEKYYLSEKRINLIINGNRFGSTNKITDLNGISQCLSASMGMGGGYEPKIKAINNNIRKLTPKECFRLMGFLDDEINLEGLSDTQKYKLAGNGWDINVVSKIFIKLLK